MNRRTLIKGLATGLSSLYLSNLYGHSLLGSQPVPRMAPGPFQPTWESLGQYKVPDWFRDAKFGIWAHWGRNANRNVATGMLVVCTRKAATSINIT